MKKILFGFAIGYFVSEARMMRYLQRYHPNDINARVWSAAPNVFKTFLKDEADLTEAEKKDIAVFHNAFHLLPAWMQKFV